MAHAEDPVIPDDLPDVLKLVIEQAGWWMPDGGYPSPEIAQVFQRNHEGMCALCEAPLGENTNLILDSSGIQIGFCGTPCGEDFHVMNWLMTVYEEMRQGIQIRHAEGGTGGEEAAGIEEDPREEEGESEEEES